MTRTRAVLLLGPTGSGKTPLGDLIEAGGLAGARWHHFDFGEHLRAAAHAAEQVLSTSELDVVRRVLHDGALLEDRHFPIAAKILRAFIRRRLVADNDWIVLNGLPRHAGQADDVEEIVYVSGVIELACTPEVVRHRILGNTGGDRTGRIDDDTAAVERKLRIYRDRTVPLLDHYRRAGAVIVTVNVDAHMAPADTYAQIDASSLCRT